MDGKCTAECFETCEMVHATMATDHPVCPRLKMPTNEEIDKMVNKIIQLEFPKVIKFVGDWSIV